MSATRRRVRVVAGDMVTALGLGTETCWAGLLAGRCALAPDARFYPSDPTLCFPVGVVTACDETAEAPAAARSRFMRILSQLMPALRQTVPMDAQLILATTVGEADLLEADVLCGKTQGPGGDLHATLARVREALGLQKPGILLSAACASATSALALGADLIAWGRASCVCVIGCDALSEFAYSGFLSLQALSHEPARPFDPARDGLNLGEAAGYALLMSDGRAHAEGRPCLGYVEGWGQSGDAIHMTTPAPDGSGLTRAIERALQVGACKPEEVAAICAHGTGTPFNDAMEEKAFQTVFENPPPVYGIKGAMGHTLGAAGVVEACLTLRALHANQAPPTIGHAARGAVATSGNYALTTNSGFGGVNVALLLKRGDE